ncbi:MAG TPA: aminotransferase class V-fold PLP-dependent enzyme [Kofleriaceae bacterium]
MTTERAQLDGLTSTIGQILPSLEKFLRFEGEDPGRERSVWLAGLREPLPQTGQGAQAVLDALNKFYIPYGLRIGHPGFAGWITTGPTTIPAVAAFAANIAGAQRWWISPSNFVEVQALRWLAQLHGLPDHFEGAFVTGGSLANLVCIAAARQYAGEKRGVDVAQDGWTLPSPRLYGGVHTHHVLMRACGVTGLGRRALRLISVDREQRIDLDELRRTIDQDIASGCTPIAVVASAGDVNTGTIDPIDEMRVIAHERGIWFHVDGAYGSYGVLDERIRPQYGEFGKIDSLTTDPHKWMNAPLGCGAAFVRDGGLLQRTFALEPTPFLPPADPIAEDVISPFMGLGEGNLDFSVDQSAPGARGAAVWAILKEIGVEGMRDRVKRHCDMARHVARRIGETAGFELMTRPSLSLVCFRYHPSGIDDEETLKRLNQAIFAGVARRGRTVCSFTVLGGRWCLRPCWVGARSTLADADALVDEVSAVAQVALQQLR